MEYRNTWIAKSPDEFELKDELGKGAFGIGKKIIYETFRNSSF